MIEIKGNKVIINLIIVSILGFAAMVFFVIPKISDVLKNVDEIKTTRLENQQLEEKLQALVMLNLEDLEKKYTLAKSALLADLDQEKVFSVFDLLIEKIDATRITTTGINFTPGVVKGEAPPNNKTASSNLNFSIELKGDFQEIDKFINYAEIGYPLMSVINIAGLKEEGDIKLTVDLMLHVFPERRTLPILTSPLPILSPEDNKLLDSLTVSQ